MFDKVLTADSVLHKVGRFCLERAHSIWDRPFVFTPVLFALAVAVSSTGLLDGIRQFFLLYLIVAILLSRNLKNVFLGFFLTYIFTLQFVHPNKGYDVEVIRGSAILEPQYYEGYSIAYFFHMASFFFVLAAAALIRELLKSFRKLPKRLFIVMGAITVVWLLFVGYCLYGITVYSPFPALSMVWLFQYSMMYFVALGICFGLVRYPKFRSLFFLTLAAMICTQFFVSVLQLWFQRSAGLHYEANIAGSFATGLDENNAVFRVMGTFMFHNQLAFVSGLLSSVVLPYGIEKKSVPYIGVGFVGLFIVLLTQSRSALIGAVLLLFLCGVVYKKRVLVVLRKIGRRRILTYGVVAFALSAFGIIPRILLSVNTGYEGAGLAIRVRMVTEAREAIIANPFIGYGVGTNEYVLQRLFPDGVMTVFPAVVHLAYIQLWMEIGLIGLVIFLLPLLWLARYCIVTSARKGQSQFYRVTFLGGLLIALVFWLLLPHIGIIEFPFMGLVLGFGSFWYYLSSEKRNA